MLFLLLLAPFSLFANDQALHVFTGEKLRIEAKPPLWVESSQHLLVQDLGSHFELKALKAGQVQVRWESQTKNVFILSNQQKVTHAKLLAAVPNTLGLQVELNGGQVQITGKLLRWKDWEELSRSCKNLKCDYRMAAQIPNDAKSALATELANELQSRGLPPVSFLFEHGAKAVTSLQPAEQKNLQTFFQEFGIEQLPQSTGLDLRPLIEVKITLSEIRKNAGHQFGVRWPETVSNQVLPAWRDNGESQMATLTALEDSGKAQVLARPNLLCRSGETAEYMAGGEIPIRITNYKTREIVWKKYGILLKVSPLADSQNKMSVNIDTEVSTPDFGNSVDGIPTLHMHRLHTHFDLAKSQLIVLSGLFREDSSESRSGLPLLNRIPVLGALFSSQAFQEKNSELFVFVEPRVIRPDVTLPSLITSPAKKRTYEDP